MPVRMEVGAPLDNNRVEVKANYNGAFNKRFSVDKDKSDEFIKSYKKTYNKISIFDTISMCILGGLGGILGGRIGQNLQSTWARWGLVGLGGIAGWILSAALMSKPLNQMEQNTCAQFGAEVIKPEKRAT